MSNVIQWPGQVDQDTITLNFLERVLPPQGLYYACVKHGAKMHQTPHETVDALWTKLREEDRAKRDVYFAVASFSSNDRTIESCSEVRSLRLDIDYGAGHARAGYQTYDEAREALRDFCLAVGLPPPMVVESGGGFHVYWAFAEALPRVKWQRYADGLKAACLDKGLRADHSLTINPVVILRPPGTFNRKLTQPRLVKFEPKWLQFPPGPWTDELLSYAANNVINLRAKPSPIPPKPEFLNAIDFPEEAFPDHYEKVNIEALAGSCGVVRDFQRTGDQSEPVWMRHANLFHYVDNGEQLFHDYSRNNYPNYDQAETQRKWDRANSLTGPPLCEGFKDNTDEKTRAICLACPLMGVIKTPLQGVENEEERVFNEPPSPDEEGVSNQSSPAVQPKKPPYVEWDRGEKGGIRATFKNAVMALSRLDLTCRYDEFHLKKFIDGKELDDALARVIREKIILKFRFDPGKPQLQEAIDAECERNRYDPVHEYLKNLRWDGIPRLASWLCRYLGADATDLNRAFGRKTLIAAVRRVRRPGCKFDQMLVLEGPQNAGKSSAWRILAGDENFSDERIKWDDPRQQKEAAGGVWIHEIPEMVGLRKADVEAIKSFLSRQNDRGRSAYAHNTTDQPRRCIHVGTINPLAGYLTDPTGARRFWPVGIGRIDLARLRVDRDQLWAEAAHYEAQDESLELPVELYGPAADQQDLRRVADPWDDILSTVTGNRVASLELMQRHLGLGNDRMSSGDGSRIAAIMRRLNWDGPKSIRIEGKVVRGYERTI